MNVIAKISCYFERSVVTLKLRKEYLNTVTIRIHEWVWIAKWVASSGRVQRSRVRFRAAQKCWAQMEFVNIYHFQFHPMFKYACVCCVRFVLNLIYSIVVNLGAGL